MPELVNDWDPKRGVAVRWATKCRRCGGAQKSDASVVPEGWEEDTSPNADGCTQALCPDCRK